MHQTPIGNYVQMNCVVMINIHRLLNEDMGIMNMNMNLQEQNRLRKLAGMTVIKETDMKLNQLVEAAHPAIKAINQAAGGEYAFIDGDDITVPFTNDVPYPHLQDPHHMDRELGSLGFKADADYEWGIAMGDDDPHAVVIHNAAMLDNKKVVMWLSMVAGDPDDVGDYDPNE